MQRGAIPLVICCLLAGSLGEARAQSRTVGPLGEPSRIKVVGVQSAAAQQVVEELLHDRDVAYASFPDAPLTEFERLLFEKTLAGLRNSGFPNPRLSIVDRTGYLELLVQEGPRWTAAGVEVLGAQAVDARKLREGLLPARAGAKPAPQAKGAAWPVGSPAPLGEPSRHVLSRRVKELLAEQGFPRAKFAVEIAGDPGRRTASVRITIIDEGAPLRLDEVEFAGAKLHSREQILTYLQLPAETILSTEVRREIEKRLLASGRFTKCKFQEPSADAPPRFAVDEFAEAPRLDEPLSPEEDALLKLAHWVDGFERQNEDMVGFNDLGELWFEMTISPQDGGLLLIGTQPRESGRFDLAIYLSEQRVGIYSMKSGRKLEAKTSGTCLMVHAHIVLLKGPPKWQQGGEFLFGGVAGSAAKKGRKPHAECKPVLLAAAALSLIRKHHANCQWDGPILTAQQKGRTLRVDSRDGKLVDLHASKKPFWLLWWKRGDKDETTVSMANGHFQRRLAELERATAGFPNLADGRRPASCLIEFLCQEPTAWHFDIEKEGPVFAAFNRLSQRGMFRALDELVLKTNDDRQDEFVIPTDGPPDNELWSFSQGLKAGAKMMTTRSAVPWSDALFARGSRPWLAWREASFIMSGKTAHLDERLARLFPEADEGPLTDLVLAEALTSAGLTEQAGAWARRGQEHLTVEAFRRDYAAFLAPESPVSGYLIEMADALRELDHAQVKALCKLPSKEGWVSKSASFRALVFLDELRADPDRSTADALSAAVERLWQLTFQRKVAKRLEAISSASPEPEPEQSQVRRREFLFR